MYDSIIIGGGPAGLSAAIYLRRALKKVLIIEEKTYGGAIVEALMVTNYPGIKAISGPNFAKDLYEQAIAFGSEYVNETVEEIINTQNYKEVRTNKNTYKTKTIIIASGERNRKTGLPNENNLIGKGISYCATCDGHFFKEKDVAVYGGGNSAISSVLYLSGLCSKVYLINRREILRADKYLQDKLKAKDNIEYVLGKTVKSINGTDKLESVTLSDDTTLDISALFVQIGQLPNTDFIKNLIKLDERGYVISDDCKTNVDGIYVAGDVRTKDLRQLITASSDGAVSATLAIDYLEK